VSANPPARGATAAEVATDDAPRDEATAGAGGGVVYRIVVLSLLGVVVGALASLAAIAFVDAVGWLNARLLVSPHARIQYEEQPALVLAATVLVPALGGLLVGLLVRYGVREQRALGPVDSIVAVQTREPAPDLKSGLGSTVAALVSLGCGASVGQYGPMVYLGTIAGSLATRLRLRVRNLQAISIGCGVAAAIATAFNAPITGIVFAHEVILRHYAMQAFAPATVASATGYVIANVIFERPPLFLVTFEGVQHGYEFVLIALEGLAAAFVAVAFMRLLLASGQVARRLPVPFALRPMLAGLVLGVVALEIPEVLGIGSETLRFATIEGAFRIEELALIVSAKLAMTVLCLGFGFVGGVFSPALLIGILFGAFYGMLVELVLPLSPSGVVVYAICGMMAVTSPVIGAPLTTILIVFELTRSYDLTIAAMVAVVFANLVAYRIFGRSLFDVQLKRAGFDLSRGRDQAILQHRPVRAFMTDACTVLAPDDTIADMVRELRESGRGEAVVVDRAGRYVGLVRLQETLSRAPEVRLGDLARPGEVVFDETTTIWQAMERLRGFVGEAAPLVAAEDRRFLGVVPESAVIRAYLEAVHDLRREEHEAV